VSAYGPRTAWETRIKQLTAKEAKPNLPAREKQRLRLMLFNAQTQLNLIRFEGW